jgi:hypothetical protein
VPSAPRGEGVARAAFVAPAVRVAAAHVEAAPAVGRRGGSEAAEIERSRRYVCDAAAREEGGGSAEDGGGGVDAGLEAAPHRSCARIEGGVWMSTSFVWGR